jgi:hypothetical protein
VHLKGGVRLRECPVILGKSRKPSMRIADAPAEIREANLRIMGGPNLKGGVSKNLSQKVNCNKIFCKNKILKTE